MNDKINFLKFFFESGKYAEDLTLTSKITDLFPAIVYIYDADARKLRYGNRKFIEYFGFTYDNVNHHDDALDELVFKDDLKEVKEHLNIFCESLEDGTCSYECRLNHKDGGWLYFRVLTSVLRKTSEGHPASLLFIAQDIMQELQGKAEVDSLKKMAEETEELLQFGSWTLDVATDTMVWTAGLYLLLGYSRQELEKSVSKEFYTNHIVNGYRDVLNAIIDNAITQAVNFEYEYIIQTKQGIRKTVFTKGKVVLNGKGHVEKVLGLTRDITAIRNFEKEQERSIRELNRSNKELEEFAYVASHDLQEPLRKISMFSERLKTKLADLLDPETRLFIERITAASAGMSVLIDDLLQFSRINRSSHNFLPVELADVIDQAVADLELKIEETGTNISISGVLPRLEVVLSEMKQLFGNLLSNAIKFRKSNAPSEIRIVSARLTKEEKKAWQLAAERTYYKIDVCDHGIGFEEEHADKIFQIFHRLHGRSEYPGSGIGLAICKKIVDNHNGIIFAHSEPGKGATFTVMLPEKQL